MALSKSLGTGYMDQFYKGAYFVLDGGLYYYKGHVDETTLSANKYSKQTMTWNPVRIMSANIPDMATFAWPKLGYREFAFGSREKTKTVWLVSSARSAMRGLQDRHVRMSAIPQYSLVGMDLGTPRDWMTPSKFMPEVFFPHFTKFSEGMDELVQGKSLSFALNEDYAVSISTSQSANTQFDVMHRGTIVGEVLDNREVILPRRMAKRNKVLALFEGRVRV